MSVVQITCDDAFKLLRDEKNSILIDVRTQEETKFAGVVDASEFDDRMALIQWKFYPDMKMNQKFAEELNAVLSKNFENKDHVKLLFMCRSGARSDQAAYFSTTKGYHNCFNVISGFEGDHDAKKHRGNVNGWKASNLPWVQS
ncbi:MAG: rhodanese-like domain-containing protein [Rickettsiales bacterium]|nr:rhodanese-like domain-containing protein [Rickettsiales bacterium]